MTTTTLNNLLILGISFFLGCSGPVPLRDKTEEDSSENESVEVHQDEIKVSPDRPSDSTGGTGGVSITFGTHIGNPSMNLLDEDEILDEDEDEDNEDKVLVANDNISIVEARLNLSAIKLVPNHELSDDEEKLEEVEKAESEKDHHKHKEAKEALRAEFEALHAQFKEDYKKAKTKDEKDALKEAYKSAMETLREKGAMEHADDDSEALKKLAERDEGVRWLGPYIYDLITGTTAPEIEEISLEDGTYKRIEYRLRRLTEGKEGDSLLGHSMVIQGIWKEGDNEVPFSVFNPWNEKVRIHAKSGIKIEANAQNALQLNFDALALMKSLDLTKAERNPDGEIVISHDQNKTLLHDLRKNIKSVAKIRFDDKDVDTEHQHVNEEDDPEFTDDDDGEDDDDEKHHDKKDHDDDDDEEDDD